MLLVPEISSLTTAMGREVGSRPMATQKKVTCMAGRRKMKARLLGVLRNFVKFFVMRAQMLFGDGTEHWQQGGSCR